MNRLLEIGFEVAGHWSIEGANLRCELLRHSTQENILYTFVSDGAVQYIGKTSGTLRRRMSGYARPHEGQGTNWRNNARIKTLLLAGAAVDVFALPDSGLMHYGQFHLNLAAGLEDSLITLMRPPWNRGAKEPQTLAATEEEAFQAPEALEPPEVIGAQLTFAQPLAAAYREKGFFNVGVVNQAAIGADGESIEIYLGDAEAPTLGTINRHANTNATPRIMGGPALRHWFQGLGQVETVTVEVLSPTALRLRSK